jgi:PKD repeat protein
MKRIAIVSLAVVLMLLPALAMNCGNGNGNGDTAAIKSVIRDMWDAFNEGDYARCLSYSTNYGDADEQISEMTAIKIFTGNGTVKRIDNINISGSTATASVTLQVAGQTDTEEVELVKTDGGWKIDMGVPPEANFVASATSGSVPLQVQFSDQSVGEISDWAWDFDNNGTVDSTEQNPTYTYATWGVYTVSLTVTHIGLSDTETKIDYIDVYPWSNMSSGTGFNLRSIWGSSSSDVFAVGASGTILHYDGSAWSTMDSGSICWLSGVWGSSSSDVFAVGSWGTLLHYDGSSWSNMSTGTANDFFAVWGTSSTDVFTVGYDRDSQLASILHYDGGSWSETSSGITGQRQQLFSLWGSSSSDVFAGCDGILHYDGSSWSTMTSIITNGLWGIWGSSSSDVFAVGNEAFKGGTILHYDGSTWSAMTSGTTCSLWGIWGSSSSDVFAVGGCYQGGTILHYDGSSWSNMGPGTTAPLRGLWGSSPSDVFAVGAGGTILHFEE